ncbi:Arc family DNA-binding protein [Thermovorax subterraneus]|nr:Arc family DNA-binding protein [Thermovorax subterraneus]
MASLTIRNIPASLLERLRRLSEAERRSLNNEIIVILEKSLKKYPPDYDKNVISVEAQVELWNKLAGEWDDSRSSDEIINDILSHRTAGRGVKL